ncbi:MAG: N-acetyl-gamma-glutamyl-phosphate reductase [Desulfosudaceae bacterium]
MIRAAVIGATGYAGAELVRLLAAYPRAEISLVTSRQYAGAALSEVYPVLAGVVDLVCREYREEEAAAASDVVFTALPHKIPMNIVPGLLAAGCRVVDLSADFRFSDVSLYESAYQPHAAGHLCDQTVYGLCEVYGEQIKEADLVGNPGCYPTSILLPLIPLIREKLVDPATLIADAKSGVSGAGRSASLGTHICEVSESFKAYKVAEHRHAPEMEHILSGQAGEAARLTFVPHLVPMNRGMLATIYADLKKPVSEADIREVLAGFYRDRPFIRVYPADAFPETRFVRGGNECHIGVRVVAGGSRLILVSAIDNLVKGAAGQAVQNMNLMFGIDETVGLDMIGFPV